MKIENNMSENGNCERLVAKVYTKDFKEEDGFIYNFSNEKELRIISMIVFKTYCLIEIYMNTREECFRELSGQLTDGIFENARYAKYEIIE